MIRSLRLDPRLARAGLRAASVLSLVGAGLLTALVIAEVTLRLAPGLMPAHAASRARLFNDLGRVRTRPDSYIGFLYPPNYHGTMRHYDAEFTFTTDSRGFRNSRPWPRRADVVVLGDSVTFGFGVPDGHSWVDLAARELGNPAIVNLALPAFGPLQQLRVYEMYGAALRPRVVLVGFFAANDFWDTAKFLAWLRHQPAENYLLWRDFGIDSTDNMGLLEKTLKQSYLLSLVWAALNPPGEALDRDPIVHDAPDGRLLLLPHALQQMRSRAHPGRPEFDEAMQALKKLDGLVRKDGGHMVVVLLPSKEYVYLPLQHAMKDDPLRHLYRALDDLGVSYLNLTPRFRDRAAAGDVLFFEVDGHPNTQGYALIADAVAEFLRPLLSRARAGGAPEAVEREP